MDTSLLKLLALFSNIVLAEKRFFITFASRRSRSRVARQSSAKASTAVRIRPRPQRKSRIKFLMRDFYLI